MFHAHSLLNQYDIFMLDDPMAFSENVSHNFYTNWRFSEIFKNIRKVYIFSQNFSYKWILKFLIP